MKKTILNLGKLLSNSVQKDIHGGFSVKDCKVLPWCDGLDNYIIIQCRCYLQPH